jgi:hypothetical protein
MSSSALRSGLGNSELSQRATLARLITLGSTQAGHVPHEQMILEWLWDHGHDLFPAFGSVAAAGSRPGYKIKGPGMLRKGLCGGWVGWLGASSRV